MSVLVEAFSIIVRRITLQHKYPGGLPRYQEECPNRTFCMDEYLTRIGFMAGADASSFVGSLQVKGLVFSQNGKFIDIAVVNQRTGLTAGCDWLQFDKHLVGFSICWLVGTEPGKVAVPEGWKLENSLSKKPNFVDNRDADQRLKFLRHADGNDVFLDAETGKEVYVGRPHGPKRSQPLVPPARVDNRTTLSAKKSSDWQVGERLHDRWEIYNILKGGMGIVSIVYDQELHEPFAVKTFQDEVFSRSPDIAERFTREALTWINLDSHPNVVQARMVHHIQGKPYLFLEYVSGGDLSQWIGTPRLTKNLPQALHFALQFCDGMNYAISKGLSVHRDIKPQNCLVTQTNVLKITDFGLAKVFDNTEAHGEEPLKAPAMRPQERAGILGRLFTKGRGKSVGSNQLHHVDRSSLSVSRTGMGAGTVTHMAPEQFDDAKHVDLRADIYSFGVMLFQMITGQLPFSGHNVQEIEHKHKTQAPPRLGSQDMRLRGLVEKCLAKKPNDRFSSFLEVRRELEKIYERISGTPTPAPVPERDFSEIQIGNKGLSLCALGKFEEAITCWDQLLKREPFNHVAWSNKGVALGQLSRSEEALVCHDRAIEIDPNNEHAWNCKGAELNSKGRQVEALACYKRALEINPNDAKSWYDNGVSLLALGRVAEAIECWSRALEINPHDDKAWANKGTALSGLRQYEEALQCLDRALTLNPQDKEAWFNKGIILAYDLKNYRNGLRCFEAAHQLGVGQAIQGIQFCQQHLAQ